MILSLRGNLSYRRWLRLCVVASLLLALLAFPCGPLAAALGSDIGHALAAAKAVPADSGDGDAECTHRVKEHESSCCNVCSSWLTARFDDSKAAIANHASSHRDLSPAAPTYITLDSPKPVRERQSTGPPPVIALDGTSLYSKTQRYRI